MLNMHIHVSMKNSGNDYYKKPFVTVLVKKLKKRTKYKCQCQ